MGEWDETTDQTKGRVNVAIVAITSTNEREAAPYVASVEAHGGEARILTPDRYAGVAEAMDGVGGLLLAGGVDIHPRSYGHAPTMDADWRPERDEMELAVLRYALDREMPALGICRGMQLINVAFGGTLLQDIPGHRAEAGSESGEALRHDIYVSPGSKLGAIIGAGAIYKVNSRHHQGLQEAQRAPGLLASAYHPDDGVIEALESPGHPRLIGVQCHPERERETPRSFLKLFDWLVGWAERFEADQAGRERGDSAILGSAISG